MQKNLVGYKSDAGSIIDRGVETLMSLDREPKYAQGIKVFGIFWPLLVKPKGLKSDQ